MNKNLIKLIGFPFKYLSKYGFKYMSYILFKSINLGTYIVQPFVWAYVLSDIYSLKRERIYIDIIYFILIEFLQVLSFYFSELLQNKLCYGMVTDIKGMMIDSVVNFKMTVLNETKVGEFVSKFHSDVVSIVDFWNKHLPNFILESAKLIIMAFIILFVDYKLFTAIVILLLVFAFVFIRYGKEIERRYTEFRKVADIYFSNMYETMNNMREIKNLGIKDTSAEESKKIFERIRVGELSYNDLGVTSQFVTGSINTLLLLTVLMYSAYLVIQGDISAVKFVVFFSYVSRFGLSIKDISRINSNLHQGLVCFCRVNDILFDTNKFEIDSLSGEDVFGVDSIELNQIKFSYDGIKNALDNISLSIRPNTMVAIVGPSGNGKSTLLNVLSRLYSDYEGQIYINNVEIRDIKEKSLRKLMTRVYQEPLLFNMSIRDNLKLADDKITDEMIVEACKAACIDSYIESLPEGYDTIINENSNNLSVGQKQRIAIARALLTGAKVLLLDEITSALDNETQEAILKMIDNIRKNHTVIVVSHKISNIITADNIVVIDGGEVNAIGKHDELIIKSEVYKRLYEMEQAV